MAIRRQNRTIWILAAVVFLVLVTFLIRDGKLEDFFHEPQPGGEIFEKSSSIEEQYGDKVPVPPPSAEVPGQEKFTETLDRMAQCLQIANVDLPAPIFLQIESVFRKLQGAFGTEIHQADRWMAWHLRSREGKERRLRLEITETDEGKIGKELHYFDVDRQGQTTPIEIASEKAMNPTDEVISQMLKEGEVFYKERAAVAFFAENNRVEFLEKDGELSELLVIKGDRQFRCANVKTPELCQCL